MSASEVLVEARALIEQPGNWTKGAAAKNAAGISVDPCRGTCFCAVGAIWRVTTTRNEVGSDGHNAEVLLDRALKQVYPLYLHVPGFNDSEKTTHSDVLAVYDLAIKMAKEEENAGA